MMKEKISLKEREELYDKLDIIYHKEMEKEFEDLKKIVKPMNLKGNWYDENY